MKPYGRRKHFNCKIGSKHFVRINGKIHTWWGDVITPNKKAERQAAKKECNND